MTYNRNKGWVRSLKGVIIATLTPFDDNGVLDLRHFDRYVDFLASRGAVGMLVGGTTGEFIALTSDERSSLITASVRAAAGRLPVIAQVGHVVLSEALRLAESASLAGANALAGIVPYFHAHTEAAIIDNLRAVARHVPDLPFFVYNYPAATGNRLTAAAFAGLLSEDNVAGVKLSVATTEEMEPFMKFLPEVCIVSGNDGLWQEFTALGGSVVVSGDAAVFPELMIGLFAAYLRGAKTQVAMLAPLLDEVTALSHDGQPQALKELLRSRGLDMGPSRVHSVSDPVLATGEQPSKALLNIAPWSIR